MNREAPDHMRCVWMLFLMMSEDDCLNMIPPGADNDLLESGLVEIRLKDMKIFELLHDNQSPVVSLSNGPMVYVNYEEYGKF